MVSKYRPKVPVLVVTNSPRVQRQCAPVYSLYPFRVDTLPSERWGRHGGGAAAEATWDSGMLCTGLWLSLSFGRMFAVA